MAYKVIYTFADLKDKKHLYHMGDTFPRVGLDVSEERIKELSGSNNKVGKPLIKEVKDDVNDRTVSESKKLVRQRSKKVARKVSDKK